MKSRLILPVLGLYWSAVCVWGTTYTYNVTMVPGRNNLFANQLNLSPNDLDQTTIGTDLPVGSELLMWNPGPVGGFTVSQYMQGKSGPVWSGGNPNILPGQAFICLPNSITNITIPIMGTANSSPTPIPGFAPLTNYYLLGSQVFNPSNDTNAATYVYHDITGWDPVAGVYLFRAAGARPGSSGVSGIPPMDEPPATWSSDWHAYAYDGNAWHSGSLTGPIMTNPPQPMMYPGEAVFIGPAAPYTILGTVTDTTGAGVPNVLIQASAADTGARTYAFTDANGNYACAVTNGDTYTVSQILSPCWTQISPANPSNYTVTITGPGSPGNNFEDQAQPGSQPDLSVLIGASYPGQQICPNSNLTYQVVYRSSMCSPQINQPTLSLVLPGGVTYDTHNPWTAMVPSGGSQPTPVTPFPTSSGMLRWNLGVLPPGAVGIINVPVTVNGDDSTSPPELLNASAYIQTADYKTQPVSRNDYVRCAYDPNDKTVVPAGPINGNQLLTYTVEFENPSFTTPIDVVVTDSLDPNLDPSTVQVLGASANYVFQLSSNQMTWTFPNIDLPDSIAYNGTGSYGFFSYQVRPLPGLPDGTLITNQASVLFYQNAGSYFRVATAITTNVITSDTLPAASFTVTPRPGSAGHTNDFTYTGGTAGATFLWDFGTNAIPPTSADMSPSGIVFQSNGMWPVTLQVFSGGYAAVPASALVYVGVPVLNIARVTGNQVVLSWDGQGYLLQQADSLSTQAVWQTVSPALTHVGTTSFAPLATTNTSIFYRLTDQP